MDQLVVWATMEAQPGKEREVDEQVGSSHRLGPDGRTQSLTLDELRARVGPMADLLAAPAAFSGARAGQDLGWYPTSPDLLSGRA